MVVNEPQKPKPEEKSAEQVRAELLEELNKESDTVLSLAYFYAKSMEQFGENVTTRWKTAALQTDALNRAYAKGWQEGRVYGENNKGNINIISHSSNSKNGNKSV